MTNNKILFPVFGLLLLFTLFCLGVPFFWDSTFFSAISVYFFENGLNGFIAPLSNDTGGFPLYSLYLASMWKLLGKSLAVSHIALLPFLFGIAFEFLKLGRRYLNDKTILFSFLFLLIDPVFLTQSMIMGYDILITYFFLLSLNALQNKKHSLYSIALLFLCLVSIRGIILASSLFFIDLFLNQKFNPRFLKNYIPSFSVLLFWVIYHKQQTGWYLFSPTREGNSENFSNIEMMGRQLIYIIWKNIDLGRIALWFIFLITWNYASKNKKLHKNKDLLRSLFIPLLALTLFMILIKNPIGHKYFLVVFVLLHIGVCYMLQQIENKTIKQSLIVLIVTSLIMGNFINYSQRYGNAWDSALKIVPYFQLEKEMKNYVDSKNINPKIIGTQFPLTTDTRHSYLSDTSHSYSDIDNDPISKHPYFLYSNIINSNRMNELEEIKANWVIEKELFKGGITLTLYRNPNL